MYTILNGQKKQITTKENYQHKVKKINYNDDKDKSDDTDNDTDNDTGNDTGIYIGIGIGILVLIIGAILYYKFFEKKGYSDREAYASLK